MDMILGDTTLVILVGGYSRRFGNTIKALLPFAETTMLDYILRKFSKVKNSIVLSVANSDIQQLLNDFSMPIIVDIQRLPLLSLVDILSNLESKYAIVMPVDMPMIEIEHCRNLIQHIETNDLIVNSISGKWLTSAFFAINLQNWDWNKTFLNLSKRSKLTDLIRFSSSLVVLDYNEPQSFVNINTKNELDEIDVDSPPSSNYNINQLQPRMFLKSSELPLVEAFTQEINSWKPRISHIDEHIRKDIEGHPDLSNYDKDSLLSML